MKISIFILLFLLIIPNVAACAITHEYGPFYGKVIDAETKEPIDGAAVLVVFYTEEYGPAGAIARYADALGTVTNKNGEFSIPAYRVSVFRPLQSWDPHGYFTIFKPGYEAINNSLPGNYDNSLNIFAIRPSVIEYLEFGEGKREGIATATRKTKTYPEGLIYTGRDCKGRVNFLKNRASFIIDYIFIPWDKAIEKIKKLGVPLECPEDGEPVPYSDPTYNFRNDIKEYINESFWIVELLKLKTKEDRLNMPSVNFDVPYEKQKHFIDLLNQEIERLGATGKYSKESFDGSN